MIKEVQDLLLSLPGIIDVAPLDREDVPAILEAEAANEEVQLVKLVNLGLMEIALREYIFVFIKDEGFRRPPCPTIYMVEDVSEPGTQTSVLSDSRHGSLWASGESTPEYLHIGGRQYHIVGEEVMDKEMRYKEKHVFFQEGFVLFPERRKNTRRVPAYFLIPPVPFPELEEKRDLPARNIMSVSPSTHCDVILRRKYNFTGKPEYATILVGFDTAEAADTHVGSQPS
jgi:hypothetical protein